MRWAATAACRTDMVLKMFGKEGAHHLQLYDSGFVWNVLHGEDAENIPASPARSDAPTSTSINV